MRGLRAVASASLALLALWALFFTVPYLVNYVKDQYRTKSATATLEPQPPVATVVTSSAPSDTSDSAIITQLQARIADLEHAAAVRCSNQPDVVSRHPPTSLAPSTQVNVNLVDLLAYPYWLYGISWAPYQCLPPFKTVFPSLPAAAIANLTQHYMQAMQAEMADLLKVPVAEILTDAKWDAQPAALKEYASRQGPKTAAATPAAGSVLSPSDMATDPTYLAWRRRLSLLNSAWLINADRTPVVTCPPHLTEDTKLELHDLGVTSCRGKLSDDAVIEGMGYAYMPNWAPSMLAHLIQKEGFCTSQVFGHRAGWGDWLLHERMDNPDWRTLAPLDAGTDTVLHLFDIVYERQGAFKRQYFMGVITMQNPFDMYAISDVIHSLKPDLVIETGTANGGSALLWSGMMELAGCGDHSRILTVDVLAPNWETHKDSWGGQARNNPTENALWKKRVTFIQGRSTDTAVVQQVAAAAAKAQRVLVLLDSDHSTHNVKEELAAYCGFVTVGSYCIAEDTKLSRWGMDGPLPAIQAFIAGPGLGKFTIDRKREPFYTHHASGYLKRVGA